eukprot:2862107-Pleurochrysis_carterae.AAC.1
MVALELGDDVALSQKPLLLYCWQISKLTAHLRRQVEDNVVQYCGRILVPTPLEIRSEQILPAQNSAAHARFARRFLSD